MRERISELDKSAISLIANTHTHTHTHAHVQAWRILTALGKTFCLTLSSSRLEGGKMVMTKWIIVEPEDEVNMLIIALKGQKTSPNRRHGRLTRPQESTPWRSAAEQRPGCPVGPAKPRESPTCGAPALRAALWLFNLGIGLLSLSVIRVVLSGKWGQ